MNITVENPGECPLRHYDSVELPYNRSECSATRNNWLICKNEDEFPDKCPLRSRTIIIEKAEKSSFEV